ASASLSAGRMAAAGHMPDPPREYRRGSSVSSGGALRRRHFDREMRQAEVDGRAARAGGDRQGRVERTEEPASQAETEAQTAATLGTRPAAGECLALPHDV